MTAAAGQAAPALAWSSGVEPGTPPPPDIVDVDLSEASRFFLRQYERLGPVYRLPLANRTLTVLAGPAANVFVARHGDRFFTTKEFWSEFDNAMERPDLNDVRDGEANRQQRASKTRSFSRRHVVDHLPEMVELVDRYTPDWRPGQSIVVLPAMQRIVAEQLGRRLAHHGAGDYLPDLIEFLDTTVAASLGIASAGGPGSLASPAYVRAKQRIHELGTTIVAQHRACPLSSREPDLVDGVLATAAKHPERYPEAIVAHTALSPLLAGLQTVSNTVTFLLYAILEYPSVLDRVQAEVDRVFADGPLTWAGLKSMRALRGAMMESMRLFPVAYGHVARVAQPLTVEGCRLDAGDDIFAAMSVSHFLPEVFPDPDTFDIDRFDSPRNEHNQPGAFAPFGLGSHACLGAGIAEVQMMVIVAALLRRHRLALDPPDLELQMEYTPVPTAGTRFRVAITAER